LIGYGRPVDAPELDDELRQRLGRRFGRAVVNSWLGTLPPVLSDLAARWEITFDSLIQRGSVSVVMRCRDAAGRGVVLKLSPARERIVAEAAALVRWNESSHVPAVLAIERDVGALLIEAIEPGTPLDEITESPPLASVATLISSLHAAGHPNAAYRSVSDRVTQLFESSRKLYEFDPKLTALITPELYDRSYRLAVRLAAESPSTVVLHGDLTPSNVLDGGPERGLVAIDPAPCRGDPAFDAVDLVLFRATSAESIVRRAGQIAERLAMDPERLLEWCAAFAPMLALEIAERHGAENGRVQPFVDFARRI
jgi:streptomycin 6-kinase